MKSLEKLLQKIDCLRNDLTAEIVIQEEEGQDVVTESHMEGGPCSFDKVMVVDASEWRITKSRIVEPNVGARENARNELRSIYENSYWCSARYSASSALGVKQDIDLVKWHYKLAENICAYRFEIIGYKTEGNSQIAVEKRIVDRDKRLNALKDASVLFRISKHKEFYDLIEKSYEHNEDKKTRVYAGRVLGYSRFKIFWHEWKRK